MIHFTQRQIYTTRLNGRNIHHQIRQQMRDMERMTHGMLNPFGSIFNMHSPFDSIMGEPSGTRPSRDLALMDPFGFNFCDGLMRQMENVQTQAMNDPNAHVFSHSTMISFDGRNGGQPRVVEKTIRKTGDVKETRHAIRTGEDGIGDKLTIGHTIGDRTHVIEKKRDRDGRIRERQSFVNLAQDEAEAFDREFASRARRNLMGGRSDGQRIRAIDGGNKYGGTTSSSRTHAPRIGGSGTNAPIITLPDEEDDGDVTEEDYGRGKRSSSRFASASGGPVIREVTDDEEDDGNNHKRRKGFFGRLFKENDE